MAEGRLSHRQDSTYRGIFYTSVAEMAAVYQVGSILLLSYTPLIY